MRDQLGYMYSLTQGNWMDFQSAVKVPHYY